jgi:hypothetical protein
MERLIIHSVKVVNWRKQIMPVVFYVARSLELAIGLVNTANENCD